MAKLWRPNANYDKSKPQGLYNMPYKRLYENLTPEQLRELLQDAKSQRWEVLDLGLCGLYSLPDDLAELSNLRVINISNAIYYTDNLIPNGERNSFTELPEVITRLSSLKELYLSNTKIREVPDSITRLSNLQYLNLSGSQIREVPDSITRLSNLKYLSLRDTKIREVPYSISRLSNLKTLNLSNTQIRELPDSISRLSNLQYLNLSDTQIREVPDSISRLSNLQSLNWSFSQIYKLPDSISRLSNLQSLNLSETQIYKLPDSISRLSNLKTLDLSGCHLKAIPYSVVALGLPFVINDPFANNCVNLYNVTLDEGDLSLFEQPREVIEAYYKGRVSETLNECKVIFLGDGAAGKSSLIERMVNGNFVSGSLPTDGVKMTKWETTVQGKPFTLRILDFGGQEIMHSMHRCFLTAHTLYVIVCESRDDTEIDSVAARWLETVKAFAPDCPVILALNKADLNANVSVNERDLRERNANLQRVLKTSAKNAPDSKYGVNHLFAEIQDQIPACINRITANGDMLAVKTELENMEDDYISSEDYRKICAGHHIDEEDMQYKWLNYFKELGVVYSYDPSQSDDIDTRLKSIRVLNPAWLTNGIYRLILRTEQNGFLSIQTIRETLQTAYAGDISDKVYTEEETEFILHVMRKFEISHYIGKGVEMIPLKMSKTPPGTVDAFPKKDALHLRWEGAYLPNNLIHRLLIRKFPELDTKCVWRTGGHFRQNGGGCEALAVMNEKALDVYVNGDRDCRPYLETFRGVIWNILDGLNLKPSEIICCTVDGQEGYVPYEDVVQQYFDRKDEIYIPGIRKYVNPADLLRDTYYDWEQQAVNYRQRMEHNAFRLPDNPLDDEEKRVNIERGKTEIWQIRFKITCAVAVALLFALVAFLRPDLIEELLKLLPFLGGGS